MKLFFEKGEAQKEANKIVDEQLENANGLSDEGKKVLKKLLLDVVDIIIKKYNLGEQITRADLDIVQSQISSVILVVPAYKYSHSKTALTFLPFEDSMSSQIFNDIEAVAAEQIRDKGYTKSDLDSDIRKLSEFEPMKKDEKLIN